jgi:1-acyl-sn-glycerol-3-phosphate acyltransferase
MGKHNIEKFSLGYSLVYYWSKAIHDCLYSQVYTVNSPPKIQKPHMFTLNHQNALMDAMAILFAANRPLVFLARSDIFKNPKIASILYFLKVLPVFRIRDGFENLKNNDEIFVNTVRVLHYPRGLAILPEGNHLGFKRLRQLQKGFARIAFQTMESDSNYKEFYIIPTGVEYEHYEKFGKQLIVNFGEPFDISEYFEIYKKNPAQGLTELRDRLEIELKKVMIEISSERWYDVILKLTNLNRILLEIKGEEAPIIFKENQKLAEKLSACPDDDIMLTDIELKCHRLDNIVKNSSLNVDEITGKGQIVKHLLQTLALLPLIILSLPAFVSYGWFYLLLKRIVTKKIKDSQFRTSVRFGVFIGAILPISLIINLWTLLFFSWYLYPLAILGTFILGLLGLKTLPLFIRNLKKMTSGILDLLGNKRHKEAIQLRDEIFEQINHTIR